MGETNPERARHLLDLPRMRSAIRFVGPALAAVSLSLASAACSSSPAPEEEGTEDELVATFDRSGQIDLRKTSHILLVGDSDELGELPLYAATTKARRYKQLYPNDQIVLFVTKDDPASMVTKTGSKIVTQEAFGNVTLSDLSRLSGSKLIEAMNRFSSIASIDFFGHSTPFSGLLEANGDDRWLSTDVPGMASLRSKFARDRNPYVTLNGCNGGVQLASQLSSLWKLPVSGALTASNFQVPMSDGRWYPNDDGFFPPELTHVAKNTLSFGADQPSCDAGACVRMKPQDAPYWGIWSNQDFGFQYGLGFYKFFCNYDNALTDGTCAKGMMTSLYSFASVKPIDRKSSDDDVNAVLADWFCTAAKDNTWFDRCKTGLFDALKTGAPYSAMRTGNDYSLECDFKSCVQKFRCEKEDDGVTPKRKSCAWVSSTCRDDQPINECKKRNVYKQTTVKELKMYLEGQKLLKGAAEQ